MTSLPLVTAFVAGLLHALEADHMAAVSTFVSRRPNPVRALAFGVRWALGHSVAILALGATVVFLGLEISPAVLHVLEGGVGLMLIALGVVALRESWAGGRGGLVVADARGAAWVGAAHGAAGTAGFLAIVPAMMLSSPTAAGGYLVLFGLGTVLAMGAFALTAGVLIERAGAASVEFGRAIRAFAGLASVAIGLFWVAGSIT